MSNTTIILILVILFILLVAFVVSIFLSYNIAHKVLDKNARQLKQIENSKNKEQATNTSQLLEHLQPLDSAGNVNDMNDSELLKWIDREVNKRKLYKRSKLSLKEFAAELGLTQKRLINVFQKSDTGSFAAYMKMKRLSVACELLCSNPNWKIEAVSEEAGYASRRAFQDQFRERMGMTPTEYRSLMAQQKTVLTEENKN